VFRETGVNYDEKKIMIEIKSKKPISSRILTFVFITLLLSSCYGQVNENTGKEENAKKDSTTVLKQNTVFPQIHTNLNGMVREFVRAMYQDTKGNYWFGTNGNGIIRYDGQTLETVSIEGIRPYMAVREIVEDKEGNVWFGTSEGLVKYDGEKFTAFSKKEGLQNNEIWGLTIDKSGLIWVGTTEGVNHFDGKSLHLFHCQFTMVENPDHMLSDKLVFKIIEDKMESFGL
jgi:ligand-binding sensor domain-containing protein